MRVYIVQPGDTPSSIARRDDMAGCPKCAKDLVEANPHRESVRHPNGFLAFLEPLVPGEQLWLPEKWFDGTLDRMPQAYFDDLPAVPVGLGQLPPEHVPQLYVVQPDDTTEGIANKFGQRDGAQQLVAANPSLPTVIQADGTHVLCSLAVGQLLTLPDRWFAAGSTWSAIKPGCNPSPHDVALTPGAVSQLADVNHPPPKDISLSIHPDAIRAMQSASGGSRDAASTAGAVVAGTGAVVGTAVIGTFVAHTLMSSVENYLGKVVADLF